MFTGRKGKVLERLGTQICSGFHLGGEEIPPPEGTQVGRWRAKKASQFLEEGRSGEIVMGSRQGWI